MSTYPKPSYPQRPATCSERWQRLHEVVDNCVSLFAPEAKPVHRYLKRQGVENLPLEELRQLQFHPALPYITGKTLRGYFPAMIAGVHVEPNLWVNLHCTYLTKEGHLAAVRRPKRLLNPVPSRSKLSGAVRLFTVLDGEVALTEDIESALRVYLETGVPAWACLSPQGMANLILPHDIHTVRVMTTHKTDNEKSAWRLVEKLRKEGRRVYVHSLSENHDNELPTLPGENHVKAK